MFTRFLTFVVLFYSINAEVAPFITKCKAEDTACLKKTTQNVIPLFGAGIPELGVDQLDPFFMKSIDASKPGLKLLLNDLTITGLKDCIAKRVTRDLSKSKITAKLQCTLDVFGKYETDGNIFIVPIKGNGDAHVILRKLVIYAEGDIADYTGDDGQTHWTIKKWDHVFELRDKSSLELTNLYEGNKVLGDAVKNLLATNGNGVITEIGPPIVKAIVEIIIENIQNLFKAVPVSELTLD